MGRTVVTSTQLIQNERQALANFRRTLRKEDQQIFDQLFANAQMHSTAVSQATHALPFESTMLAMLLEERKELMRLRKLVEEKLKKV